MKNTRIKDSCFKIAMAAVLVISTFTGCGHSSLDTNNGKSLQMQTLDSKLKTEKPLPFRKTLQIKVKGRGGTSFQPLFDYAIKNQRNYDGLIIFTDGFAPEVKIHRRFTTKVLWVLNNRNLYCNVNESLSKTGFVTALA